MGYVKPKHGENAFNRFKSSNYNNPLMVPYRQLGPKGYVKLRFLDLTDDGTASIPCRTMQITNPNTGKLMTVKDIQEPEDLSEMNNLIDHAGNPMSACQRAYTHRCPVFVYTIVNEKGEATDVNRLMYLEFGPGLRASLGKLENNPQSATAFDPETGRPNYDVLLLVTNGNGNFPKNYEFQAVTMGKGKSLDPHYDREIEEILKEEGFYEEVDADWDEVQDAIHARMTLEEIQRRLAKPQGSGGISNKLSSRDAESDSDESDEEAEAPRATVHTGTRRYNR